MTPHPSVLILSAPVGAGHDVAARRVADELRAAGRSAEVVDGLALLGPRLERLVIEGYRLQLRRAPWSWGVLYAATRNAATIRALGTRLAARAGPIEALLEALRPDVVLSTYPLISAALAGLRRAGRLRVPCASLMTDFDPHPGWIHPDLDANLLVADSAAGIPIRPPVPHATADRVQVRTALGVRAGEQLALVAGGAWGVGPMAGAARALCGIDGVRPVVVTGHNTALRERLAADRRLARAAVLGYRRDMLQLIAASDLLIQHAGGLTCLEAFVLGTPVVMFDPVAGHGVANTKAMVAAGVVEHARGRRDLEALLTGGGWTTTSRANATRARRLADRPSASETLHALAAEPSPTPPAEKVPLVGALNPAACP